MAEKNEHKASDYIEFYTGLILIAAGIFFLLSKAVVHSNYYGWSIGGLNLSTGLVVIPVMIGIIWLFNNPKSILARIITFAGAVFIVASIILTIRISFTLTTMFDYVIMMLLLAAGIGLFIKSFSLARKDNAK